MLMTVNSLSYRAFKLCCNQGYQTQNRLSFCTTYILCLGSIKGCLV